MFTKTKMILIAIIVLTFTILFLQRGLRLQVGSNQYHAEQQQIFSGNLINVTGELLMSRSDDTLSTWQATVEASRSIDFWLYDFTYQPLLESFKKLARTGVKIRGIIENQLYGNNSKNFNKLHKIFSGVYHIDIHSDEALRDNFMHAKTFLMDDAFIIQTANLGYAAFFNNREFFFISHNAVIKENLEKLFAKDRAGQKVEPGDIHPNVLFCPIDCRHKIETILSGAKRSIRMYQQYIMDESVLQMLMDKHDSSNSQSTIHNSKLKVDIKLIVADNDNKEDILKTPLKAVTHVWKKPYVHAKMILVDDTYLIVSSINLSANSMDENREIGIVIIDAALIKQFKQQFERDRNKSQSTGDKAQ